MSLFEFQKNYETSTFCYYQDKFVHDSYTVEFPGGEYQMEVPEEEEPMEITITL